MPGYIVVYINRNTNEPEILPLVLNNTAYDFTLEPKYVIRITTLVRLVKNPLKHDYYKYIKIFEDDDPAIKEYVNKLKLVCLLEK